jgi:hypothetical protein
MLMSAPQRKGRSPNHTVSNVCSQCRGTADGEGPLCMGLCERHAWDMEGGLQNALARPGSIMSLPPWDPCTCLECLLQDGKGVALDQGLISLQIQIQNNGTVPYGEHGANAQVAEVPVHEAVDLSTSARFTCTFKHASNMGAPRLIPILPIPCISTLPAPPTHAHT